jgi:hypothetical protein
MMRAGFAIVDITPRERKPDLNGFAARTQPSTRIAAPVSARVVLLDDGEGRVVIAVCDLLGFRQNDSYHLERAIGKATGTAADHVLLLCTHNHSGAVSMPLGKAARVRPSHLRRIERQLIREGRGDQRCEAVDEMTVAGTAAASRGSSAVLRLQESLGKIPKFSLVGG